MWVWATTTSHLSFCCGPSTSVPAGTRAHPSVHSAFNSQSDPVITQVASFILPRNLQGLPSHLKGKLKKSFPCLLLSSATSLASSHYFPSLTPSQPKEMDFFPVPTSGPLHLLCPLPEHSPHLTSTWLASSLFFRSLLKHHLLCESRSSSR